MCWRCDERVAAVRRGCRHLPLMLASPPPPSPFPLFPVRSVQHRPLRLCGDGGAAPDLAARHRHWGHRQAAQGPLMSGRLVRVHPQVVPMLGNIVGLLPPSGVPSTRPPGPLSPTDDRWLTAAPPAENFSGSGYERNQNGATPLTTAWAQPSGLALAPGGDALYVADSESSTVRQLDLRTGGSQALVGGDPLFSDNLFRCRGGGGGGAMRLSKPAPASSQVPTRPCSFSQVWRQGRQRQRRAAAAPAGGAHRARWQG